MESAFLKDCSEWVTDIMFVRLVIYMSSSQYKLYNV